MTNRGLVVGGFFLKLSNVYLSLSFKNYFMDAYYVCEAVNQVPRSEHDFKSGTLCVKRIMSW